MTNKSLTSDLSIFIGNVLEHFNSTVYICLSPLLAPIFFPNYEPIVQNILIYSILATSMFSRPIGAIIFGGLANHYGPALSLSYSLAGITFSTILLGFLPGYSTIGKLAPLCLILIKLMHSIFASGENTIASLYIIENKTITNRFKSSYYYAICTMLGITLAAFSSSIIINIKPNSWRICFWLGGIIGLIGSYLRYLNFKNSPLTYITSTITLNLIKYNWNYLLKNKINIIYMAAIVGFTHITYVLVFVLPNSLIPLISNQTTTLAELAVTNNYLLIFDLLIILIVGKAILKFQLNYAKMMLFASSVLTITILPLFNLLEHASIITITLIKIWIIFWAVIFVCPLNLWCEQFLSNLPNPQGKYFLMGISNNIGSIIIGKTCTPICLYLWYKTNSILALAVYINIVMLFTVTVLLLHHTKKKVAINLISLT